MKLPAFAFKTIIALSRLLPFYLLLYKDNRQQILKDLYYNYHHKYDKLLTKIKKNGFGNISCNDLKTIIPFLEKAGYHEELQKSLSEAIKKYPDNSFFNMYFARFYHFKNNIDEAFRMATKSLELDSQNTQSAALMITLKYINDKRNKADKFALELLTKYPLNIKVLLSVCYRCASKDQFKAILEIWQTALKKGNNSNKLYVQTVPHLVTAAARANMFKEGIDLSFKASLMILQKKVILTKFPKSLRNKYSDIAIRDICEVFNSCKVPFFFAAGTALGFIREGKVLEHDADIDVGIMEKDWAADIIMDAFNRHPHFLLEEPHPDNPKIGLVHCGGADIDIFRFYKENDSFYHNGGFVRWKNSIFNTKKYSFDRAEFFLPDPADKYLTENYGNWKLPDPQFDAFLYAPN
ncbi:MAG TPA: hypothetical protein P5123_03785, partial [Spirochaetota bacterium]|nr:hypothetical protein [Spirochaetota bacterium]